MYAITAPRCTIDYELRSRVQNFSITREDLKKLLSGIYLHSGRTDSSGGHKDNKNKSGLGSYHYHHGVSAHLHPNGVCPYGSKQTFIINPYTGKRISLGQPYLIPYYDENSPNIEYYSLNLVSKALTAQDKFGASLGLGTGINPSLPGGSFYACPAGNSSIDGELGENLSFAYPKNILGFVQDNTFFKTDCGKLQLLCHNKQAEADDAICYAYVSLESIREYMMKNGYFTDFSDNGSDVWNFTLRKPIVENVEVNSLNNNVSPFNIGDTLTIKAYIDNVANAKLIVGKHTEAKDNLLSQNSVEFNSYVVTDADAGILTVKVEVNTGGTAIGAETIASTVQIQIGSSEDLLTNIEKDITLGLSNDIKKTMVGIGRTMLNEGYEPTFIAGMLANIKHEGKSAGFFESSAYTSNPSDEPWYLLHMDTNYNYRVEYSGQNIKDKKLSAVYDILAELGSKNWPGGFGLGSVQWTFSRTTALLEVYMETTSANDTITFEQMVNAEGLMIIRELSGYYNNEYTATYDDWNPINPDSIDAAYDAGVIICKKYERPQVDSSKARGETAKLIYAVMLGQ